MGDVLYLLRCEGSYAAGFKLQHSSTTQHACSSPSKQAPDAAAHEAATDEPAAKRHKLSSALRNATQSDPSSPAAAGTQHSQDVAGPFGSTIAAAAAHASPVADPTTAKGPARQQQQQQLFAGVRLVNWDGHHTQLALKRAAEEGAVVSQLMDDTITHVIAR